MPVIPPNYRDGRILTAANLNASFSNSVSIQGDTMLGPLMLSRDPQTISEATTKKYVDGQVFAAFNKANSVVTPSQTIKTANAITINAKTTLVVSGNNTFTIAANLSSTTQPGVVQLTDTVTSTSTNTAATANSVLTVFNSANTNQFSRNSPGTYFDYTGTLQTAANNQVRIGYNPATLTSVGVLLEPQRTNVIRNPRLEGAVISGSLPTNWSTASQPPGSTGIITGIGVENGLNYIDFRITGNSSGGAYTVRFDTNGNPMANAISGQTWTGSCYVKLISGTMANITNVQLISPELSSTLTGLLTHSGPVVIPTGSALSSQPLVYTFTTTQPTCTYINLDFAVNLIASTTANATFRISGPQLELGNTVTSLILPPIGNANAATRLADVSNLQGYHQIIVGGIDIGTGLYQASSNANLALSIAQTALFLANSGGQSGNIANSALNLAQSSFTKANTSVNKAGDTMTGQLTLSTYTKTFGAASGFGSYEITFGNRNFLNNYNVATFTGGVNYVAKVHAQNTLADNGTWVYDWVPTSTITADGWLVVTGNGNSSNPGRWIARRPTEWTFEMFGAVGDGITDDYGPCQTASDTISLNNGGVIRLGQSKRYYIGFSDLSVKKGIRLKGAGPVGGGNVLNANNSALVLNPGVSRIYMGYSAGSLEDLVVVPKTLGMDSANLTNATLNMTQTAQWASSNSVGVYILGGANIRNCTILGFNTCLKVLGGGVIENLFIDGYNGVEYTQTGDVATMSNVRCEPWYSLGVTSTANGEYYRAGIGFNMHDRADGVIIDNCFAFCWNIGFRLSNIALGATLRTCAVDFDGVIPFSLTGTTYGIKLENNVNYTQITDTRIEGNFTWAVYANQSDVGDSNFIQADQVNGTGGVPNGVIITGGTGGGTWYFGSGSRGIVNGYQVNSSSSGFYFDDNIRSWSINDLQWSYGGGGNWLYASQTLLQSGKLQLRNIDHTDSDWTKYYTNLFSNRHTYSANAEIATANAQPSAVINVNVSSNNPNTAVKNISLSKNWGELGWIETNNSGIILDTNASIQLITNATLVDGGSNYANGNIVPLNGGTFQRPARIRVNSVNATGSILTFSMLDNGIYASVPAGNVGVYGIVSKAIITANGFGYGTNGAKAVITGDGTGADFFVSTSNGVIGITQTNNGIGYTNATIQINALVIKAGNTANGTGATATATIANGALFSVTSRIPNNLNLNPSGDTIIGKGSAYLPSDNTGHLFIPTHSGTPNSIPINANTGAALRYDTKAHRLWVYDSTIQSWQSTRTSQITNPIKLRNRITVRPFAGFSAQTGSNNTTVGSAYRVPFRPRYARVILYNNTPNPSNVNAVAIAVSSKFNTNNLADTAFDASGNSNNSLWTVCTFNNGGDFVPSPLHQTTGNTTSIIIPGTANGTSQYSEIASDWTPISVAPSRIDGVNGYLMFVRTYGGSSNTLYVGAINNPLPSLHANSGGFYVSGDHTNANWNTTGNILGLQAGYGIQVIGDAPGLSIMCVGDSIQQGAGTTGGVSGMGLLTASILQNTYGAMVVNLEEAVSGRKSADFIPNGYRALMDLKPDVLFIQAISENDIETTPTQAIVDQCIARAMALADTAVSLGKIPVITTAAPYYSGIGPANTTHEILRTQANTLVRNMANNGFTIIDIDALVSTAPNSGTYAPGLGYTDGIHPSDAGCAAIVNGNIQYPGYLDICLNLLELQ